MITEVIKEILENSACDIIEIGLKSGKQYEVYSPIINFSSKYGPYMVFRLSEDSSEKSIFDLLKGTQVICIALSEIEYVRYNV